MGVSAPTSSPGASDLSSLDHEGGEVFWPLPQTVGGGRVPAPPPGLPGKRGGGCRAGGGGGERAARRSQELTLLAGGSCSRCTSGSGLRPCPRPPPSLRYLPGMLAAPRASGACFWGQPAPPPAPGRGSGRRGGRGERPARISWLLPLVAALSGSRAALRLGHGTGKGSRTWLALHGAGGPQGPAAWPPLQIEGN